MTSRLLAALVTTCAATSALAESGWSIPWIYPYCSPGCGQLDSVNMLNEEFGIAVGKMYPRFGDVVGTLAITDDGGAHWRLARSLPREGLDALYKVQATSATTAIAVGAAGTIIRTTDTGITWTAVLSRTTNALYGLAFEDVKAGIAVGAGGTILRTTDGGINWTPQFSGTTDTLYGVASLISNEAIAVGDGGTILRTTDGGETWAFETSGTSNQLRAVSFANISIGTAVGAAGTILRTSDAGETWTSQVSGTSFDLLSVDHADSNTAVIGGRGKILRTVDGGEMWLPQELPDPLGDFLSPFVVVIKGSNGIAAMGNRIILRTVTAGESVTCTTRCP